MHIRLLQILALLTLCTGLPTAAGSQTRNPVPQTRSVTISTEPNAAVWIDGVRYGKTDSNGKLTIRTVAAGGHTLRVRADGFKEKTQPLTAAQRGEVKVILVKTTDDAELAVQAAERLTTVDREKAAEAYKRALKLRPDYAEAYIGLARILSEAGDLEEAKKAISSVRRLRAGFAEASAIEGRIHKENGEEQKAILSFKRAITEGRGFQPEAYAGLGLLYKEKAEAAGGNADYDNEDRYHAESAKYLKIALKQLSGAPDAIVIYQLLGLIYERQKKTAEAIAVYEEFLRFFPDAVEAEAVRSFIVQLKKDQVPPK